MNKIIYLHGFQSSGESFKAQWFKSQYSNAHTVVANPTYPVLNPNVTIDFLKAQIEKSSDEYPHLMLVGSSMGGFYAQYLAQIYQLPYILINPALSPVATLSPYKGQHQNPFTGECFTIDELYLSSLLNYEVRLGENEKCLVLLDKADEVIDPNDTLTRYQGKAEIELFEGGGHAFCHLEQAKSLIDKFISKNQF